MKLCAAERHVVEKFAKSVPVIGAQIFSDCIILQLDLHNFFGRAPYLLSALQFVPNFSLALF